jgi:recombination protein RecA
MAERVPLRRRRTLIRPRAAEPVRTGTVDYRTNSPACFSNDGTGLYFTSDKENISFIHTGCVLLDCVLGGGYPLGRIVNIVGDRSTGKTLLAMEAIANFFQQYAKGRCYYCEAEAAFDPEYAAALGIPFERCAFIEDIHTVEELFNHLELVMAETAEAKAGITLPCLYIIDSLDALSDDAEMERGIGEATYGGAKAKKLSETFRRLTQRLKTTNICLMVISQVRDNIGAMFGEKHTRSGGKALDFYASQVIWLANIGQIKRTVNKVERPVGIKIRAKAKKNKVGLPYRDCDFEITFGYGIDDMKASREWLKVVGKTPDPKMTPEQLTQFVLQTWYDIEKTFLPTRRKYGIV